MQPFWEGRYKLETPEETREFELCIQPCNATGNNLLAWSCASDIVEPSMVIPAVESSPAIRCRLAPSAVAGERSDRVLALSAAHFRW